MVDAGFADPDQRVAKLSGGWRKRLAILAEVIREPNLLLLDGTRTSRRRAEVREERTGRRAVGCGGSAP